MDDAARPRRQDAAAVTHAHEEHAAAAAGHGPPLVAVLASAFLVVCMLAPTAVVICSARRARLALRFCPRCAGAAVRYSISEGTGLVESTVVLECGQCGTWRRLIVNEADARAHARRVRRQQRSIHRLMLRLEADRRALECHAFIALLRSHIAGADDFLAVTRPPRPQRRARHQRDR
jgi:hypothetical protein